MTNTQADSSRWQRVKDLLAQALDLEPDERQRFLDRECGHDASLRGEIESLLTAARSAKPGSDPLATGMALEAVQAMGGRSWIGRQLGPYRVVSLIANGGMGTVYRAERVDGQFTQQVAVKVMRDGSNTDELAARFLAEQRILASLEHPNLAKVLDGGITDDGVPYFIMELVEGEPIDVHVERLNLSVEGRVRLFRKVCEVVHYAHQKRVVHRDLKADNILVRHDGVVKLVDFGIAKRIDPAAPEPSPQTATAQRMMTLVYSSPEQVRGGEITPASDIYSLGVVLYRLLTKTSPYGRATGDSHYELARAICDTEPAPPSTAALAQPESVRRQLRGDLDAVVMMALRKDPSRRYASAEAMSEDLFRHLEGLPVQARRGAWSYRAGRFLLRNRAVVGAVMAANLALVVGIAAAGYEAWQANQQRARAERDFARLHRLASVFVFDIHDAIQNLPGSTDARWLVVRTALSYLEELRAESQGNHELQIEVAAGYRKVADILGRPYVANLGDPKAALENYDKSRHELEPLVAAQPPDTADGRSALHELALTLQQEGALFDSLGRYKEAETAISGAVARFKELPPMSAAANAGQVELATAYVKLAAVQYDANELPAYRKSSDQAIAMLQAVLAKSPDDRDALLQLSVSDDLRGQYLSQSDSSPAGIRAALASFRQAVAVLDHLHDIAPDRADVLRKLAGERSNVGSALSYAGDLKDAVPELRGAIALLAQLAARDPRDMDSRGTQALVTTNLGDLLRELGQLDDAVRSGNEAIAMFARLADGARLDASMRSAMGVANYTLAKALDARAKVRPPGSSLAAADRGEACKRYDTALGILQALKESSGITPGNLDPATVRKEMQHCGNRGSSQA